MDVTCIICHESLKPNDVTKGTLCGHVFHDVCLNEWLRRSGTCPQCRSRVNGVYRMYLAFSTSDSSLIETLLTTHQNDLDSLQAKLLHFQQENEKYMKKNKDLNTLLLSTTNHFNTKAIQLEQQQKLIRDREVIMTQLNQTVRDLRKTVGILREDKKTMESEMLVRNNKIVETVANAELLRENINKISLELASCKDRCFELEALIKKNNETPLKWMILENIVGDENIQTVECDEIRQIREVADEPAAVIGKISEMIKTLTVTRERCFKLEESTADFSRRFLNERAINKTLETKLEIYERERLEKTVASSNVNVIPEEVKATKQPKRKTVESEPKTEDKNIGENKKTSARASRAPLRPVEQNSRYNLRPR